MFDSCCAPFPLLIALPLSDLREHAKSTLDGRTAADRILGLSIGRCLGPLMQKDSVRAFPASVVAQHGFVFEFGRGLECCPGTVEAAGKLVHDTSKGLVEFKGIRCRLRPRLRRTWRHWAGVVRPGWRPEGRREHGWRKRRRRKLAHRIGTHGVRPRERAPQLVPRWCYSSPRIRSRYRFQGFGRAGHAQGEKMFGGLVPTPLGSPEASVASP
jgi:hypothetical protein